MTARSLSKRRLPTRGCRRLCHVQHAPACAGLLARVAPAPAPDRDAYKAAEAKAGRDPVQQIKLALWCEATAWTPSGSSTWPCAVLIDPEERHGARADGTGRLRWALGVAGSRQPAGPGRRVLNVKLAQYEARRSEVLNAVARPRIGNPSSLPWPSTAAMRIVHLGGSGRATLSVREGGPRRHEPGPLVRAEWFAAGGHPHFGEVAGLHPRLRTPWEHLGCKKHKGRWMTDEQIAAEG